MDWKLNTERPIYAQLIEQITELIVSGVYQPGSKMPSVRDLAQDAAVNPNTMQKALAELERNGIVHTQRTSGRFITEDIDMLNQTKQNLAANQIASFLERMSQLGFTKEEIISLIQNNAKEND
ncbi:MAG: GntR family transcriptional regulator [Oscillospiraceae bacterium]